MNELTEAGPLGEAVGRRYGAQGGRSGLIVTVATDMFPMLPISDELMDPELHFFGGSKLAAAEVSLAAGGIGLFGIGGLQNPATSGIIAVIQEMSVQNGAAAARSFSLRVLAAVTAVPDFTSAGFLRDSRWGDSARSTALSFGIASAALIGDEIERIRVPADTTARFISTPLVLAPNSQVNVDGTTANEDLRVNIKWRERRIQTWERA